jgi:iron complex transport system ATP-binding protein
MVPDFEFTVMDIVLMGRAPYLKPLETETPKDIEAACSAMKMTNVLDFKDKKINEISGGERQRAQIACALAQETGIILLDEPVSNLDIQHQIEILGILRKLKEDKQMTVIAVLHDLNLAAEYSDSIILIKDGEILKYGTPEDIINPSYIKRAYGTDLYMTRNPVSGKPHIIPIKNI